MRSTRMIRGRHNNIIYTQPRQYRQAAAVEPPRRTGWSRAFWSRCSVACPLESWVSSMRPMSTPSIAVVIFKALKKPAWTPSVGPGSASSLALASLRFGFYIRWSLAVQCSATSDDQTMVAPNPLLPLNQIVRMSLPILSALAAVVLFINDPEYGGFPMCPFRSISGLLCPGCGSQRAIHDLLHLRVHQAFEHNALLVLCIPLLAIQWLAGKWIGSAPLSSRSEVALGWLLLVVGWCIARNLCK